MTKFQSTHPGGTTASAGSVHWHRTNLLRLLIAMLAGLAGSLSAANIATEGTGILGINDAIDGDAGIPRYNAGTAANINDGSAGTRVDNWFDSTHNDKPVSLVGIIWPTTRYESISSLTLTLATFTDGGWFGTPGIGPGGGGVLTPIHLLEPTIQVTTDGGVTWTAVGSTSDYLTVMNGHGIGGGANPNPTSRTAVFTLSATATKINGIRIIGANGGFAGPDTNGFLGVFELAVEAAPVVDSDGDGMPDAWEQDYGLIVGINDSAIDSEPDGLTNLQEFQAGTHPTQADTDGDGLNDGPELATYLTNPRRSDTDGDGLNDGAEVITHFTDPLVADTDGDGLSDGDEVNVHLTNPRDNDTDFDGFSDGMEVAQGSDPNNPGNFPDNVALIGTGIIGTKPNLLSATDNPYYQTGTGAPQNINDGNLTTRLDTYNGGQPNAADTVSYVGITWTEPLINPVVTLDLTLATFVDGGWFGVNNSGPGAGGALTSAHLREPEIQISLDGSIWTPAAHTSDYLTALDGHKVGGGTVPNPSSVKATFTLNEPANGLMGIRIAGTEGGTASAGFLGVFELAVRTPVTDSDNDGMNDAWERLNGLTVGIDDSAEDPDSDGLTNVGEFNADTNPQVADTDGDTLSDGDEVNVHHTNPNRVDTDGDGLNDNVELEVHQTDPLLRDTDSDGFSDGLEVSLGTSPTNSASFPSNFALIGSGIMGTKDTVETGVDTPYYQAGMLANINDGNLTTRVDTWNNTATSTASYVGILWDDPVSHPIVRLQLSLAIFFDGGWFGVNGIGPGTGGFLSAVTHLTEPTVQVSTNGGTNWATIGQISDYLTALDGQPLPTVDFGAPTTGTATFYLDEPQTNINAIRIIATEGGTASGGFLGVFELEAHADVPQPVTLLNVGIAAGQFRFEFDTQTGRNYPVEYKATVDAATWETLTTIAGDGTRKEVTDSLGHPQRIYRVITE